MIEALATVDADARSSGRLTALSDDMSFRFGTSGTASFRALRGCDSGLRLR
jgi:hypothetical protein